GQVQGEGDLADVPAGPAVAREGLLEPGRRGPALLAVGDVGRPLFHAPAGKAEGDADAPGPVPGGEDRPRPLPAQFDPLVLHARAPWWWCSAPGLVASRLAAGLVGPLQRLPDAPDADLAEVQAVVAAGLE